MLSVSISGGKDRYYYLEGHWCFLLPILFLCRYFQQYLATLFYAYHLHFEVISTMVHCPTLNNTFSLPVWISAVILLMKSAFKYEG
jgi:hypothetical protein